MSILIVTQTYHPTSNGQGAFTVRLAQGLARSGYEVHVLRPSVNGHARRVVQEGVIIHGVTSFTLAPLVENVHIPVFSDRQVRDVFEQIQPQIIHIQDHYPLSREATRQARRQETPIVGTNHFLPENMIPYIPLMSDLTVGRRLLHSFFWKRVTVIYNQLDHVVAPTQSAVEIMLHNGLVAPVCAISCGVELSRFNPERANHRNSILQRYHLDPSRSIFLYVGRVDREKGLDTLVKAARKLDGEGVQFAIAGDGNYKHHMREQIEANGLERRVVLCGYVPAEDLPDLYHSADGFIMPSPVELQSIATLEAMASGLPVLAARARALPELVHPGSNGYLFPPGDGEVLGEMVSMLARHPKQRAKMSQASLQLVQPHDMINTLHQYENLYHAVEPSFEVREYVETFDGAPDKISKRPFPDIEEHRIDRI